MSDNIDDFLAHYGVAGMKWGKRRAGATKTRIKANAKGPPTRTQKQKEFEAEHTRALRNRNRGALIVTGLFAARVGYVMLEQAAANTAVKRHMDTGQKAAEQVLKYAKVRGGAAVITSLRR